MDRILETIIDAVLGLQGTVAYVAVGGLAFGEAAAFLGLVTPGEVAMVLGGVLASRERTALEIMCVVASVAAVLGESTGYWLGRSFGRRLLAWRRLEERFGDHIERSMTYIRRRGGRAIVLGRWVAGVRTFIPFTVGMTGMPYGRFLAFSVPSATTWALVFVLLGYAAGQSWHVVERYAGRASFILLLVVLIAVLLRWAAKRVIANRERLRALGERLAEQPAVSWMSDHFGAQLRWLLERFDPRVARGLGLTLGFFVLAAAGIAIGVILNDVSAFRGLARLDFPVRRWFATNSTDDLEAIARVVSAAFRLPWALLPVVLVAAYGAWRTIPRVAARVLVGALGAAGLAILVDDLVTERLSGTRFPPPSVTIISALVVHVVAVLGARLEWAAAVMSGAVGVFAISLVGLATLIIGEAALSGAVFGGALGIGWASAVEVQARLPFNFTATGRSPTAPERTGA